MSLGRGGKLKSSLSTLLIEAVVVAVLLLGPGRTSMANYRSRARKYVHLYTSQLKQPVEIHLNDQAWLNYNCPPGLYLFVNRLRSSLPIIRSKTSNTTKPMEYSVTRWICRFFSTTIRFLNSSLAASRSKEV
jgi:hypothetical protein